MSYFAMVTNLILLHMYVHISFVSYLLNTILKDTQEASKMFSTKNTHTKLRQWICKEAISTHEKDANDTCLRGGIYSETTNTFRVSCCIHKS